MVLNEIIYVFDTNKLTNIFNKIERIVCGQQTMITADMNNAET
jgi:hypothetical protein